MEGLGPSPIGGFWPSLEGTDASDFCGSLPEPSPLLFISSSLASKSLYLWAGVRIVVAYSASWSSYCSRASFHSSSLRPRRSSGGRTFHQTVGQTRPKIRSPPFWYDLDDHIPVGLTRPINPMASPVPVPLERSKTGSEPIDRSRVYSFSDQFHIKGPCATNSKTTGGRIQCQSQQWTPLTEYRRHSARIGCCCWETELD
ncbi:hypothetical protein VIGAN_UM095800 [Vigna angularis var. angularis]|uniref:Uncharacterized protein n=1 Tax=Vigna angularis var. angularis TaxID=157739 RepID=A0A0S3TEI7_PHAAN|nr:hypothetical protein VIGAN_UM095800 [Vigna angularis var. angularis]